MLFSSIQLLSCVWLYDPIDRSTPGLPVHHQLPDPTQAHIHWVSDAIQPSHPLLSPLLLPSIFPSLRVFSNESALCIRWLEYWSFSFNISPPNEHSGLISFRMDCYYWAAKSCPTLCNPMDCSTPGFPDLRYLPEFAQIHVHWVSDAT